MLTFASKRRGWAFILPTIAIGLASSTGSAERPTGGALVMVVVACAVAGALWQILHRRDLADRLTYFAAAITGYAGVFCIHYSQRMSDIPSELGLGGAGTLAGLVYTEQWLRGREDRARRRYAEEVQRPPLLVST